MSSKGGLWAESGRSRKRKWAETMDYITKCSGEWLSFSRQPPAREGNLLRARAGTVFYMDLEGNIENYKGPNGRATGIGCGQYGGVYCLSDARF